MTQRRQAEAEGVRRWERGVPQANDLAQVRSWVVWGIGTAPERAAEPEREERPGEPGNDIAREIAEENDSEWAEIDPDDRWVAVVDGPEDEIDAWVEDQEGARGYAAYLMQRDRAGAEPSRMRGVLHGDRVQRRPFDTGRPS